MPPHESTLSEPVDDLPDLFGFRLPAWAGLALVAALTCAAYWPSLGGKSLWDDAAHIPQGEMRSFAGLTRIWFDLESTQQYYPVLFSWFWLQFQLWGEHMLGYHLVNLLLHITAACLVYAVLQKLRIPGALFATAIFALHPVHVETVAWVTEQKNTLSAVFYLSAMLAYLHFDNTRARSMYALALGLFVLALLSKTVTVTLPPALLIVFWWQRGHLSWRRDVVPLLPFFALSAADGLLTIWVERKVLGAEGYEFELPPLDRPLLAGRALWFYVEKLIWPVNLIFIYPRWEIDPTELWQWLFPLAALAVLILFWTLRKSSRAPFAGILFFVGTLFPVLGFLNVFFFRYSYVSDHFQYLASLGLIVLVAGGIVLGLARLSPTGRIIGGVASVVMLGTLASLSWQQSHVYSDVVTLFQATVRRNPDSWMAHNNLGVIFLNANQPDEALKSIQEALRLNPDSANAHNNYGVLLLNQGRTRDALDHFQAAARLRPKFTDAHNNLGLTLYKLGRPQEAIAPLEESLRLRPRFPEARQNLGDSLAALGRQAEAIQQFQQALQLRPDYPQAQDSLGLALFVVGRTQEAIEHFQEAVRLRPDFAKAQYHLGTALLDTGHVQESIAPFQHAVQFEPNDVKAWANLGAAQAQIHQPAEAIAATERALELARAQGQTESVEQLEARLKSYRASQSNDPLPSPALPSASP